MTFRICWFASEEAKIYRNNFNSSNAVVCSHLIPAYTVRLAMINAAELERNGCFSLPLLRNVVLWLKRTSTKSLQIELVTKYDINDAQKESLVGGIQTCVGGPYPPANIDWGGPNPRRVQIPCDTDAKCPWFLVMTSISFRSVLAVPSVVLKGLISRSNLVKWLIWRERQDNGRANRCHQQWPLCMLLRGAIENFFFPVWLGWFVVVAQCIDMQLILLDVVTMLCIKSYFSGKVNIWPHIW